jgi:DNA-binding XRE family transcriptional regulator
MAVNFMKKSRTYSKYSLEAAILFGKQIQLHRKINKWTESELAERAGISRATIQKIEKGDMTCQIGLVFEVATLVGVRLFSDSPQSLSDVFSNTLDYDNLTKKISSTDNKLALLPKIVRKTKQEVDDEF